MENSFKLGLSQKLQQQLKMTPEMRLAIKILQLNAQELKTQVAELLETNPVVELDDTQPVSTEVPLETYTEPKTDPAPPSKEFVGEGRDDFGTDWQKYIQDSENTEFRISSGSYSGNEEETSFENFVSKKSDLREFLAAQLHESILNPTEMKIGEYLIGLVDHNGYIRQTPEQISELLKVDVSVVKRVLQAIQLMDPLGVGAFDLRECLMIQALDESYSNDAVTVIIDQHLDNLAANKIGHIVKETGYDMDEVQAAIETIKRFNPKPGSNFPSSGDKIYVSPDVFVEKIGEEYVATLNETDLPKLRINNLYRDTIKRGVSADKVAYDFIKDKLDAAKSFLRYVDKRKETILNVTRAICEVQKEFLDNGILFLKPLTLQDVAGMAGVHESTVSRATSGKYAQTPRGLFELKFFFSGGTRTRDGEDISTQVVRKRIEEMIKKENTSSPLSDGEIVESLKAEGITIARRTVAKYRTESNIPNASARKKF
jgi:RNA polymerase sigma-54 factor